MMRLSQRHTAHSPCRQSSDLSALSWRPFCGYHCLSSSIHAARVDGPASARVITAKHRVSYVSFRGTRAALAGRCSASLCLLSRGRLVPRSLNAGTPLPCSRLRYVCGNGQCGSARALRNETLRLITKTTKRQAQRSIGMLQILQHLFINFESV